MQQATRQSGGDSSPRPEERLQEPRHGALPLLPVADLEETPQLGRPTGFGRPTGYGGLGRDAWGGDASRRAPHRGTTDRCSRVRVTDRCSGESLKCPAKAETPWVEHVDLSFQGGSERRTEVSLFEKWFPPSVLVGLSHLLTPNSAFEQKVRACKNHLQTANPVATIKSSGWNSPLPPLPPLPMSRISPFWNSRTCFWLPTW